MIIKKDIFKIRAHHGLCLGFFEGKGYDGNFVKNMTQIKNELSKDMLVQIVCFADDICSACPGNADGICSAENKVGFYDEQVLRTCGICKDEQMTFGEFEKLIKTKILIPGKRKNICGNCEWDSVCGSKESAEM